MRRPGQFLGQLGTPLNPMIGKIVMAVEEAKQNPEQVRLALVKAQLSDNPKATQQEHISAIQKALNISVHTAIILLTQAQIEINNGGLLSKAQFDVYAENQLVELLQNQSLPPEVRRKVIESLAKIRGFLKQTTLKDAIVPPNLADPAVLEAALKLDEAISQTGDST
jgi:hypothetical protein